jgi:sugar O-acyltransferase (sialic acid O-acetyltransferase NeuD family)
MQNNNMDNIVIIGSSGHAKVVIDIVLKQGKYNIVGLLDRFRLVGEKTMGFPILGKEEDLPKLESAHKIKGVIIAIGDNVVRGRVSEVIRKLCPEIKFVSAIHPTAIIALKSKIGEGTVLMAGCLVGTCSAVGRFCIVNTNASLDHDSVLEDYASIAPNATTAGNCHIGQFSIISIGAVLLHGIQIGEHTLIGAGSIVTTSIKSYVTAYGSPAKFIRTRCAGEKYL